MNFGKAHDIWSRVVSGNKTLTEEEVKAAVQWFSDFIPQLNNKACKSKQELEEAELAHAEDAIEKRRKVAESDERQLDDFIRKYDDLIGWLNKHNR